MQQTHHQHHRHISRRTRRLNIVLTIICVLLVSYVLLVVFAPGLYRQLSRPLLRFLGVRTTEYKGGEQVRGIDVSRYQGDINWDKVARTDIRFVFVKATEGTSIVDDHYFTNFKGAKDVGLTVGSYHYFTSKSSVRAQFRNFSNTVNKHQQDLLPVVDVEKNGVKGWSKQQVQDSLQLFMDLARKHFGRYPIIYTYSHFFNNMLAPKFNQYYLFIANYIEEPVVKGAGVHNIWQLTDNGEVKGIKGPVDLDILANGTSLEDLLLDP